MAPQYKLKYFNSKGFTEPIRLLLAFAGVEYEDIRYNREDPGWPAVKAALPWGTLPMLEDGDKVLCQSKAILRYIGRKHGLAGENEFESSKCDEYVDAMSDVQSAIMTYYFEKDEAKKEELKGKLLSETFPKLWTKMSEILEKNGTGYLVGKKLSFADTFMASFVQQFEAMLTAKWSVEYPAVGAHQKKILEAPGIKEWIVKRPVTLH